MPVGAFSRDWLVSGVPLSAKKKKLHDGNEYEYNRARAFGERESGRKGSKSLEKELECQLVPFRETGSCQVPFGEKEETPRGIWHLFGIVPELGLN